MKYLYWLVFIILCSCDAAFAGTFTSASCSRADVNAIINGGTHTAVDGDIIIISSTGSPCTWTTGITIPAGIGITITGSGTPTGDVTKFVPDASCTATALIDNVPLGTYMFAFTPTVGNSLTRLSCLSIAPLGSLGTSSLSPVMSILGTCSTTPPYCPNIRTDNLTFDPSWVGKVNPGFTMFVIGDVFGVLDHNSLLGSVAAIGAYWCLVELSHGSWQGVGLYGDNSWSSADTFGTYQALYVENNSFGKNSIPVETEGSPANSLAKEGGGRVVVRFNANPGVTQAGISVHGTESNGRPRGARQIEVYGNTFNCVNTANGCQSVMALRSGVGYSFGNTISITAGAWWNGYVGFSVGRISFAFASLGVCDGSTGYDKIDGVTYYTGIMSNVVQNSGAQTTSFQDSLGGTFGSTNSLIPTGAPYAVHDVNPSNPNGLSFGGLTGAFILGNTSTTITVYSPGTGGGGYSAPPSFTNGDTYQVLRATACLDQSARSGGTMFDTTNPNYSNSNIPPSPTNASGGWVYQSIDPIYEWNDTGWAPNSFGGYGKNVTPSTANPNAPQLIENRDWYSDNSGGTSKVQTSSSSPFNGTVGVGFGTKVLPNYRPATCTTGVAYFATDEGSWNTSGNGFGNGNLYVCTSTNNWTLTYTPYTYPHPLDSNGGCTPDHLAFTTQPPATIVVNAPFSVVVQVQDAGNNNCGSDTSTITVANKGGSCAGMTLSGTLSAANVFTESNFAENATGACILHATDGALTAADSNSSTVITGSRGKFAIIR
jgi:hypothetical protein